MKGLHYICVLLAFVSWVSSQSRRLIPPSSEVGTCSCQAQPFFLGGGNDRNMPPASNVNFKLFTRASTGDTGERIVIGNARSLNNSGFKPQLPLTVISHGWIENHKDSIWMNAMKEALLSQEDMNVVIVDWSRFARNTYDYAARLSKYTGRLLARFLHFIKETYPQFSGSQVHLIGFSMGAHLSGVAGHNFPDIANITGLDPAGPAYECINEKDRLDPSDAKFVLIIHTNAGCRNRGYIGSRTPIGHQDFYVNGGGQQPGCSGRFLEDGFADISAGRSPYSCHHHRAIQYFLESIYTRESPYGFLCRNYVTFKTGACLSNARSVFGYHATPQVGRGTFFLATQARPSYLSKHIKIEFHLGQARNRITAGQLTLTVQGRNGISQETTLLRPRQRLDNNQVVTGMAAVPARSDVLDLHFVLNYQRVGFNLLALVDDFLDVRQITALDTLTDEVYCVSPRVSILISQPHDLQARPGKCGF